MVTEIFEKMVQHHFPWLLLLNFLYYVVQSDIKGFRSFAVGSVEIKSEERHREWKRKICKDLLIETWERERRKESEREKNVLSTLSIFFSSDILFIFDCVVKAFWCFHVSENEFLFFFGFVNLRRNKWLQFCWDFLFFFFKQGN